MTEKQKTETTNSTRVERECTRTKSYARSVPFAKVGNTDTIDNTLQPNVSLALSLSLPPPRPYVAIELI